MKNVKRYLLIMLALLVAAVLGAVLVWYFLILNPIKDAQEKVNSAYEKASDVGSHVLEDAEIKLKENGIDTQDIKTGAESTIEAVQDAVPIIIKKSSLPEAQQSILTTFGFGENIIITPQMQVCAEAKLGTARLAEIVSGATPNLMEATSLVSCLKN